MVLQVLINEVHNFLEKQRYKLLKSKFNALKQAFLAKLCTLKLNCKFIPTLVEILRKENHKGIAFDIINSGSNDEIIQNCRLNKVDIETFYNNSELVRQVLG